jgi:hypothetical protein
VWAVLPNFFSWFSDPGEAVGKGGYGRLTSVGGGFSGGGNDAGVVMTASSANEGWRLAFAPPLNVPLRIGRYDGVVRAPSRDATHAGLEISGRSTGCNTVSGWFEIRELGYTSNVERFDALFEQHCNNAAAALRGEIRFTANAR